MKRGFPLPAKRRDKEERDREASATPSTLSGREDLGSVSHVGGGGCVRVHRLLLRVAPAGELRLE